MIYPENFEEKVGFDQIKTLTHKYCISSLGHTHTDQIQFLTQLEKIEKLIGETYEFQQILQFDNPFPSHDYYDLRDEIIRIKTDGTYLETEELGMLRAVLTTIYECLNYIIKRGVEKYPLLFAKASAILFDELLVAKIDTIINDKSEIRDSASALLQNIRKSVRDTTQNATRKTIQCLKNAKASGMVKDDAEITIRNGRLVIPVPAAFKRKVKGFIHDESASGQTVFIEPQEVIENNNEIRDLKNAEKREIIQILLKITSEIRLQSYSILSSLDFLGNIDFIRAKAKLAIDIQGIKPAIRNYPYIDWTKTFHPLLYLKFKALKKEVVPLSIKLNKDQRILIISGPNAGGKSVCMKTVGLIQYMLQCGFPVPAHEISEFGIFEQIFIDMGDEQSIENDLSTYSSHLKNIMQMLADGNNKSLLLIDEMGSGTEPVLGSSMAEAMLVALHQKGNYAVITTHYGNLKRLANTTSGMVNGAMLFDMHSLSPLFVLKTGIQGSSFTFEIAQRIGFPEEIINSAKSLINSPQYEFETMAQQLETEFIKIDEDKKALKVADDFLAELIEKHQTLLQELESQKQKIIKEAKQKALNIIKESNSLVEKTIREIKETNAEKESVSKLRKEIDTEKQKLTETPSKTTPKNRERKLPLKTVNISKSELKEGSVVFIPEIDTQAVIIEIVKDKKVTLDINGVIFRTDLDKIEPISLSESKFLKKNPTKSSSIYQRINEKASTFKPHIDIRGKRAEESIQEVEKLIDDALQLGVKELKILHGKGTGVLRKVIREVLAKSPYVESFEDEKLEMGGHGITNVKIK